MGSLRRELGSSGVANDEEAESSQQSVAASRVLRSCYRSVKSRIKDEREEISRADSNKFNLIINELESLHKQVQKPVEQVADAETLLDIASAMVSSIQAESNGGITVSDFVSCLLRDFGQQSGPSSSREGGPTSIAWADVGVAVSHVFRSCGGFPTMIGPMDVKPKQQRVAVYRKQERPTGFAHPERIDDRVLREQSDTDKNMLTMFNILKKNRRVRLENLVLDRSSFAQTVENLFALSFLVKDGRAEIEVDKNNCHLVSPRNAPAAGAVASGAVANNQFVFRLDFKDWKLMTSSVGVGKELMPHRNEVHSSGTCRPERAYEECQEAAPATSIWKLSRNRGLVLHEQSVLEDSPENDDTSIVTSSVPAGKGKRKR